jgi:arylsulfatase A-like enzyme
MPPYIFIENDRFLGEATAVSPKISHCRRGPMEPDFKFDQVLPKLTEKTVSLIDEYSKDGPFFIYFAMPAPHTPLVPSKQFQGRNKLGPYADFCEEVDWYVGKVIEALEKNGIAQNTLLIFTSDNGCAPYIGVKDLEEQGHYPSYIYRGYKADIFEGGHRVPFMVRWPEKVPAGSTSAETICLTDLMATCADVTGAVLPDNAGEDSVSILPVLSGKKLAHPLREATVHHSINGSFALRQGTWKLEMCPGSGGWGDPRPPKARELNLPKIQLYDLSQDISERKNVYKEHPETVASMQKLMAKYIKDGRSTPGKPQPYDIPKKWHQIRWVDDI